MTFVFHQLWHSFSKSNDVRIIAITIHHQYQIAENKTLKIAFKLPINRAIA